VKAEYTILWGGGGNLVVVVGGGGVGVVGVFGWVVGVGGGVCFGVGFVFF